MNNTIVQKLAPHLFAYLILMALSFLFFSPYVFEGKVLPQGDNQKALGMQTEFTNIKAETGKGPLWTNAAFAGMPSYQIQPSTMRGNYTKDIYGLLLLKQSITKPHVVILLAMACCYLLLIVLRVDWRIACMMAATFGLSTYYIDLTEAGHSTKMAALALAPAVMAGALLAFRKRYLLGGGLFALFLAMQIYANHLQITFYMFLMLLILGVVELVKAAKENAWGNFTKAVVVLGIGGLLGVASNASRIWTTYEYSKETIRGKSELASNSEKGDGLTKDYIFDWSHGKLETFTLLIPNFNGGGVSQTFKGTDTYKRLFPNIEQRLIQQGASRIDAKRSAERQVASTFYWGNQPFVGAAIYLGAIVCFLFFLGAFIVKGPLKLWLLIASIFSLTLAWGGNFFLNHFFVDYLPMFNKFRAVTSALGITQLMVVLLGGLGLQQMMNEQVAAKEKERALYFALGITGGLCVIAILLSFVLDMSGKQDDSLGQLASLVIGDRAAILRADAFRSLFLILASGGILWAYLKGKVKALIAIAILGALAVGDIWLVNKRILYPEKYETPKEAKAVAQALPVDLEIQKDPDPHFRVLDLARGYPYTNAMTSYHHNSMGGYHAAKLMRYKDLIDRYLGKPSENMHILGMLNAKYIIQGQGAGARAARNPRALGNAWFVDNYEIVKDGDAEMAGLANLDPAKKALVQTAYADALKGLSIKKDSTASIRLTSYHPDHMVYEYSAATEQLAVFSEVYYPPSKGWNLYLDGEQIDPFVKADFILRAARLPAGKSRKLEMKFEPQSFYTGELISKIASIFAMLLFAGGLFFYFKNHELRTVSLLAEVPVAKKERLQKTSGGKKNKKK
ncbi:MAG: hypothetical protein AB8G15_13780 [Saprospiraceae bacterium]